MAQHRPDDMIAESELKFRWKVAPITIARWRESAKGFPEPAAIIGRNRRYYLRADIEQFERRRLQPA